MSDRPIDRKLAEIVACPRVFSEFEVRLAREAQEALLAVEAERDRWHEAYDIERGLRHGVEAERDAAVARAGELRDAASEVRSYWGIEGEPGYQEAMTRLAQALAADDAERGDGPSACPYCGEPMTRLPKDYLCENEECPERDNFDDAERGDG